MVLVSVSIESPQSQLLVGNWNKAINRVGKKGSLELWEPKSDLRVCSVHFESGK